MNINIPLKLILYLKKELSNDQVMLMLEQWIVASCHYQWDLPKTSWNGFKSSLCSSIYYNCGLLSQHKLVGV